MTQHPAAGAFKQSLKDVAMCLSLANLLWLEPWRLALGIRWNPFFFPRGSYVHLITVVLGVALTAAALWLGLRAAQRSERFRSLAAWVFFAACALAANTVRTQVPALSTPALLSTLGAPGLGALVIVLAGAMFVLARRRQAVLIRALKLCVLVPGPFAIFTFYEAGEAIVSEFRIPDALPSRPLNEPRPGARVVILLFDEMDRSNLALGTRTAARTLPALTRLYGEAVDFSSALAPAGARTMISVPSITTGRTVTASDPSGADNVQLRFADGEERLWTEPPNFFRIARKEGVDAFLAGWFMPYCRMFAADVSNCSWRSAYPQRPESVAASMRLYAPLFWRSIPGMNRLSLLLGWREGHGTGLAWHLESQQVVQARALEGASDPRYRLVFAHYPLPHTSWDFRGNVVENQILVDQAIGEVRSKMEETGLWDSSAVIVMSDHGLRAFPGLRHPTLLVKPPHSTGSTSFTEPVKLERVSHLVLGLLREEVRSASDVVAVVRASE